MVKLSLLCSGKWIWTSERQLRTLLVTWLLEIAHIWNNWRGTEFSFKTSLSRIDHYFDSGLLKTIRAYKSYFHLRVFKDVYNYVTNQAHHAVHVSANVTKAMYINVGFTLWSLADWGYVVLERAGAGELVPARIISSHLSLTTNSWHWRQLPSGVDTFNKLGPWCSLCEFQIPAGRANFNQFSFRIIIGC